jgi:hypothetical protein
MEVEVVEEDEDNHHRLGDEKKELPIDPNKHRLIQNKQRRRRKNKAAIVMRKPSQCQ